MTPCRLGGSLIGGGVFPIPVAPSHNTLGCRLRPPAAASVPTGPELGDGQDSVAWLREPQYLSGCDGASSATAGTFSDIGVSRSGTVRRRKKREVPVPRETVGIFPPE